jgi:hypothetical protein
MKTGVGSMGQVNDLLQPLKSSLQGSLQKLNQREKTLLTAIIAVVGLILFKALVLNSIAEVWSLRGQAVQVRSEIVRSESMLASLAGKENGRRPASESSLDDYRRVNAGLGNFIRKVSSPSHARRDFSVRKISSQKVEHLPEYDKTRLELEVEGPFQQIGAFLEEIEASHFLARVDSIHIYRMEKELRLCRARILVDNYFWREP